ncbi:MAG: hypothetical protein HW403_1428, partial [Dehalococcoidia bacterium]|nr:hypothetical protein [Dehalococcoidia bacterium]
KCHVSQIRDPERFEERWRQRAEESRKDNDGRLKESFKRISFRM